MSTAFRWAVCGLTACAFQSLIGAYADDWPQWRGLNRDGVWHETGIIDSFSGPQIKHRWRAEVSNGYSGPTVADGRVYVTDHILEPIEQERVLCFDEETGEPLWTHTYECKYSVSYPDGPRASVTIADGRAYSLGTMGHLRCLDAKSGKLLWEKNPAVDYNLRRLAFGVCSAPIVEGDLVIVMIGGRPDACIVAWDKRTGEERWRALEDSASYSAPIIIEQAGKRVLVCWTGGHIAGLDPETGEVWWKIETPPEKGVINIATPVMEGDRMFLSSFYDGSYMLRISQETMNATTIWHRIGRSERRTDALHAINSTPIILGDYVYGVDSYGEFRCLDGATGDRIWEDLTAVPRDRWATVHMVRNGDRIWMFNEIGELIITELSPKGLGEVSRAQLISPSEGQYAGTFSRVLAAKPAEADPREGLSMFTKEQGVTWSHPAFANKHVFIRNDSHLISASLAKE